MDSSELSAPLRIRLQRFLAACGLGSRRACEEYITEGRVTVDGQTVSELGATVQPATQTVALDGERLKMERKKYYVLHKPPGYLCTNNDPAGRRKAIDLLPSEGPRLFTVGRLDENSTGLLVVTNDGDLAEKLAHPKHQIYRTYHIQVAGQPKSEVYLSLKEGLRFAEGRFRVRSVKPIKKVGQSTWLEVVLSEGHNRELRRLFARVGHKVLKLTRISFGPIRLGKLKMGEFRPLTLPELESLHAVLAHTKNAPDNRVPEGEEPKEGSEKPAAFSPGRKRPDARLKFEGNRPKFDGGRPKVERRRRSKTEGEPALFDEGLSRQEAARAAAEARPKAGPRPKFSSHAKPRTKPKFGARPKPGEQPKFGPRPKAAGRPRPGDRPKNDDRVKKPELKERRFKSDEKGSRPTEARRPEGEKPKFRPKSAGNRKRPGGSRPR